MARKAPEKFLIRVSDLPPGKSMDFDIQIDDGICNSISKILNAEKMRKARFRGRLAPVGKTDWKLSAKLGATAVQICVVTLEPVTTRIDVDVTRRFCKDFQKAHADEIQADGDDSEEPLGAEINLYDVILEELSLSLPSYPRGRGAFLDAITVSPPEADSEIFRAENPFASLGEIYSNSSRIGQRQK